MAVIDDDPELVTGRHDHIPIDVVARLNGDRDLGGRTPPTTPRSIPCIDV